MIIYTRVLEIELKKELNMVLAQEESFWFQRSQCQWLNDGDRNTKYYHCATRVWDGIVSFFKKLFAASNGIDPLVFKYQSGNLPMPCPMILFVTHHGQGDVDALMQVLPEDCVQHILTVLPPSAHLEPDCLVWEIRLRLKLHGSGRLRTG
ncbi:hypothetical protein V6N13_100000 [Hibiscus sabdariffa]